MISPRVPLTLYHILDAIRDFEGFIGTATDDEIGADRMGRYAADYGYCAASLGRSSAPLPASSPLSAAGCGMVMTL